MADVQSQPSMGDFLVREGYITQAQFNRALEEQRSTARSLGRILVDMGLISENMRMTILHKRFGFELIKLAEVRIDPLVLEMIPYSFAEKHRVVPVRQENNGQTLVIALEDPSDIMVIDAIKHQVGMGVKPCVASTDDIRDVLERYPQSDGDEMAVIRNQGRPSLAVRVLRVIFLPLMMLLPIVGFFAAIYTDFAGLGKWLKDMQDQGNIQTFDLAIYIMLIWGLWAIIFYYISGLLFGTGEPREPAQAEQV